MIDLEKFVSTWITSNICNGKVIAFYPSALRHHNTIVGRSIIGYNNFTVQQIIDELKKQNEFVTLKWESVCPSCYRTIKAYDEIPAEEDIQECICGEEFDATQSVQIKFYRK